MTVGQPRAFHKKFKFVVEIDGVAFAGFQSCSELSQETAVVGYSEGGTLVMDKSPGRITIPDVTLKRGATQDGDMWNWAKQVSSSTQNAGAPEAGPQGGAFYRTADIVQQDRDGTELRRWTLSFVWPSKFVAGDWDNEADENVIEEITLTLKAFDKTYGT